MTWTIRPGRPDDTEVIARYNAAMALETESLELDLPRLEAGVRAILEDAGKGFYLVAEQDGEVIGQVMVTFEWSDWRNGTFWWIQSVYVAPGHRGQGVFKSLYRRLEEDAARGGGVCGLRLYVEQENERAQAVYARLGMSATRYRLLEVDSVLRRSH
ncbi:MAG: GNAT family N-acetyltransferase [Acidobacteria bacterium]|nr:GNAT family N-acetyltransferase [Acidobacteriota bacterium]